LAF
jgi:MAD (mothers against decapentaplegic) family protein 4